MNRPVPPYLPYYLAVMAGLWAVLTIVSARSGKWPVAAVCAVLLIAFTYRLYLATRK